MFYDVFRVLLVFFCASRRRHTRCALVTGVQTCALPIFQRNWVAYAPLHHRRASLIAGKLPHVSAKPPVFGAPVPAAALGSFTLTAPDRMLYARSEERRVGKECVSTCRSRWSPDY